MWTSQVFLKNTTNSTQLSSYFKVAVEADSPEFMGPEQNLSQNVFNLAAKFPGSE